MNKRERVEATLNLQETDRVPIYDLMRNDEAIRYFSGKYPPVGEEGLKLTCSAIGKTLDMTRSAGKIPVEPGEWVDENSFRKYMLDKWISGGILKRPFDDEEGAKKYVNKLINQLKDPIDLKEYADQFVSEFLKIQRYIGDDTVQLLGAWGTGLDIVRGHLGLELFSYIDADEPGLVSEYMDLYTNQNIEKIHAVADYRLSPCALTHGDIAYKGSTLHSPAWLRKEFFPRIKQLNDALHEHDIKCLFHSDGYLMDVLDDLINAGIDGLNPIEVVAGMDLAEIKKLYGKKIFIAGGIDISQLLSTATPAEVRKECQKAIEIASPGYFIGSTTELDNGARLENILVMLEEAMGATELG